MSNPSKRKGTSHETALVRWFRESGYGATRLPLSGKADEGDVEVLVGGQVYVIEAKATQKIDLAGGLAELAAERVNYAKARGLEAPPKGILVVKRRNQPVHRAYAVAELGDWCSQVDQIPF